MDAACAIDPGGASEINIDCADGADCVLDFPLAPATAITCDGPGLCDGACGDAEDCSMVCRAGSLCLLDCYEALDCSLSCSADGECYLLDDAPERLFCGDVKEICDVGLTACNGDCSAFDDLFEP